MTDIFGAIWIFGGLAFWPIARAIDQKPRPSLRFLKSVFWLQLGLQLLWTAYLIILWVLGVPQIQHGFIFLYVAGTAAWIVAPLAFLYWAFQRHRVRA
jgi:hypothetical protein